MRYQRYQLYSSYQQSIWLTPICRWIPGHGWCHGQTGHRKLHPGTPTGPTMTGWRYPDGAPWLKDLKAWCILWVQLVHAATNDFMILEWLGSYIPTLDITMVASRFGFSKSHAPMLMSSVPFNGLLIFWIYRTLCQCGYIWIRFESHDDDQKPAIMSPVGSCWAKKGSSIVAHWAFYSQTRLMVYNGPRRDPSKLWFHTRLVKYYPLVI